MFVLSDVLINVAVASCPGLVLRLGICHYVAWS